LDIKVVFQYNFCFILFELLPLKLFIIKFEIMFFFYYNQVSITNFYSFIFNVTILFRFFQKNILITLNIHVHVYHMDKDEIHKKISFLE